MFFLPGTGVTPALIPPPVAKTYLAMGSGVVVVSPAAPWVAAIMAWVPMAELRSRW